VTGIKITQRERDAILQSLAAGVVPSLGIHHLQVGRKEEVRAVLQDMERIKDGGSAVRFIVGRYGSGKSFFLNLLKAVAEERKFVVARADITTQRRLYGKKGLARSLYSELMGNLSTRGRPEGGALRNLVERWVGDLEHEVASGGGKPEDVKRQVVEICKPLQDLVSGYDFSTVILKYYQGYLNEDEKLQEVAVRWLRGEYSTKTEAAKDLGVRSIIDDDNYYDYLKLLAAFVRLAGYSGLLVCVDELVVLSHRLNNKIARNTNFETLLHIVNDCLQGRVRGLGFFFAATDDCVFDKRRGLFSYEALGTRLAGNRFATGTLVDRSGPVLKLENLTPEECYVLLGNVRRVHAKGKPEDYLLPDEAIEAYLADCKRRLGAAYFQTPRETLKDFVGLLNVIEQNSALDWQSVLSRITTTDVCREDPNMTAPGVDDAEDPPRTSHSPTDDDLARFRL
jgi:hypothetical protein